MRWEPNGCGDGETAKVNIIVNGRSYGVTYHTNTNAGYVGRGRAGASLIVVGPRGGKRQLNLGNFGSHDRAKQACEQHYAKGCDLRNAERWL